MSYQSDAVTYLVGGITAGQTTIQVAQEKLFPRQGSFRVQIDSEILLVTEAQGKTWIVQRAVEGVAGVQAAAAHNDGAAVTKVTEVADDLPVMGASGTGHAA